jgi:glycosidase
LYGAYPGFAPENWSTTPWTQDWYEPDDYWDGIEDWAKDNRMDLPGFDQKVQLRRYGGDLQGVFDRLDYLDSLGITAIYFNPLNDAPSLHKYDPRHWRHIDRNFGPDPEGDLELMAKENPADPSTWVMTAADQMFADLIYKCHNRGIRVILDYSWNHTGREFWAWKDLLENQEKSDYADWYWVKTFDDPATEGSEFEYRGWFGVPSLPEIKETEYLDHSNGIEMVEGNMATQATKEHIYAVSRRWLDPDGDGDPSDGVDGFRLDVAAEVPLGFWRDYRNEVRAVNPEAYLIGEVWWQAFPDKLLDPTVVLQGDIFDAVMNYRWFRVTRHFFNSAPDAMPPSEYVDSLKTYLAAFDMGFSKAMMNVGASHDSPRLSTSLYNKNMYKYYSSPFADSTYLTTKPDAATRATQKMLLMQQFTYIGAPPIWMGDEMGMWGCDDPSNRKPLIWPELTFDPERAHPLGEEREADEVKFDEDLFQYYRSLIQLRKENPVFVQGDIEFLVMDDSSNTLAYARNMEKSQAIVLFNNSDKEKEIEVPVRFKSTYKEAMSDVEYQPVDGILIIEMPARTGEVLLGTP